MKRFDKSIFYQEMAARLLFARFKRNSDIITNREQCLGALDVVRTFQVLIRMLRFSEIGLIRSLLKKVLKLAFIPFKSNDSLLSSISRCELGNSMQIKMSIEIPKCRLMTDAIYRNNHLIGACTFILYYIHNFTEVVRAVRLRPSPLFQQPKSTNRMSYHPLSIRVNITTKSVGNLSQTPE